MESQAKRGWHKPRPAATRSPRPRRVHPSGGDRIPSSLGRGVASGWAPPGAWPGQTLRGDLRDYTGAQRRGWRRTVFWDCARPAMRAGTWWAETLWEMGGALSGSGRGSWRRGGGACAGRPRGGARGTPVARMLRWAGACRGLHGALGPCRPSPSRVPRALRSTSHGGRGDAEPRSVKDAGREAVRPARPSASPGPAPVETSLVLALPPGRYRCPTSFWTGKRPSRPSSSCMDSSAAKPTSTPSPRPWPSGRAGG